MKSVLYALLVLVAVPVVAQAAQYGEGDQIVHTRRAPVIVHRVLPPFKGKHVYRRN